MDGIETLKELRRRGLASSERPLRLHLGCGEKRLDGYVNVDLAPATHRAARVKPDFVADVGQLALPDASVTEVRLHHLFEHFPRATALALLGRWHRWLEPRGLLRIETPDLEGSALVLGSAAPLRLKMAAARHLAGDQAAPWAFHLELWFPERFEHTLRRLGFDARVEARRWQEPPYLANVEVFARKRRTLSTAELAVATDELLWESTVSAAERPAWESWRAQARATLGTGASAPVPMGQAIPHPPTRGASIAGVVFSKDRPLQLEAALRSFLLHCQDREALDLTVLYATSSRRQRALYEQLREEYPSIAFVEETSFRADLLRILGQRPFWLFLVDDNLFVRDFTLREITAALDADPAALGFSLRLGRNVTYVYTRDQAQPLPPFDLVTPGVLGYDWKMATLAFSYPLEVSSSIYRAADLRPLLERLRFDNPNTLEAQLASAATPSSALAPRLLCPEISVAFSVPINRVQAVFRNRAGSRADYRPDALADAYAAGDRIDVEAYDAFVSEACHQEVELRWLHGESAPVASRFGARSAALARALGTRLGVRGVQARSVLARVSAFRRIGISLFEHLLERARGRGGGRPGQS